MLTSEQLDAWERDGFLVLPGFVAADACDELTAHARRLIAGFDPEEVRSVFTTRDQDRTSDEWFLTSGDQVRCFVEAEDHRVVSKIGHAMHDLDPVFDRFSRNPRLAAVALDVGLRDPRLLQSMYILKAPQVGGEVTLHTDHTFLWTEPQTVTGFWFALEDATLENGCLWALPGGHRLPARTRFRRRDDGSGTVLEVLDPEPYPTAGEVPLEAAKGTLVVLHGLLPHRSDANRSTRSRAAYTLHCVDASAEYPADNWLQRSGLPLRGF